MKVIKKIIGFISLVCIAVTLVGCKSTSILDGVKKEFKTNGYQTISYVNEKYTKGIAGEKCESIGNRPYLYNIGFTKLKQTNYSSDGQEVRLAFLKKLNELDGKGMETKDSFFNQNKKKKFIEFCIIAKKKNGEYTILSWYMRWNKHYEFYVERQSQYTGIPTKFNQAEYKKLIKITKKELRKAEKIGDKCFELSKKYKFSKKVVKGNKKHD